MKSQPFVSDLKEIRLRAREHVERGAVTEGYRGESRAGHQSAQRGARHRDRLRAPLQMAPRWLGDNDVTSRRMMEAILAKDEEHADDLANMLAGIESKV